MDGQALAHPSEDFVQNPLVTREDFDLLDLCDGTPGEWEDVYGRHCLYGNKDTELRPCSIAAKINWDADFGCVVMYVSTSDGLRFAWRQLRVDQLA